MEVAPRHGWDPQALPEIIQGGMGVAISGWRLASTVARMGYLGVVSGVGNESMLLRRLQDGDPGGHARRSMARFPIQEVVAEALEKYFLPDGRPEGVPYKMLPLPRQVATLARQRMMMLGAFVDVDLAKEGHDGLVGINLLTKIQLPTLPVLYGAMLAGVDAVLMGAGIPREIPGCLDAMAEHRACSIHFDVVGLPSDRTELLTFDPAAHWEGKTAPAIRRPAFLAIIAANSLATILAKKSNGKVDGFIVEGPTAGGHNAPPRGELKLNERGEPLYGKRDEVDLGKLRELGLPFWLAGGVGSPEGLARARAAGAAGIQVGTLFAFCDESGMLDEIRRSVLAAVKAGEVDVRTDGLASPTGYPFKVVDWPDNPATGVPRERVCDLGYLRTAYADAEGKIGYRCPGEPVAQYVSKGGTLEETEGRRCLCNALTATVGIGQLRDEGVEPPMVTSGDDLTALGRFLGDRTHYSAADVIAYLRSAAAVETTSASA